MPTRCLLTPLLLASCLLVATATDWPVQIRDGVAANALGRNSGTITNALNGINTLQKYVDIFNSNIFEGTPVKVVAEVLSKSLEFIASFINLIKGAQEDPLVTFLRQKFAQVNAKLDGISLQVQEVMNLIQWTTARSIYAEYELHIKVASDKYSRMLRASVADKAFRRKEFVDYFRSRRSAAKKLYVGVVESDLLLASSLADALKRFTHNHRRKVTSFLLALNRVILRGAQMEIAYQAIVGTVASANLIRADWADRMKKYTYKMKAVEDQVKAAWQQQLTSDANAFITNNRGLNNQDFAAKMYRQLTDKFDWQNWVVVAYGNVKGTDNHLVRAVSGACFFRVVGDRNVAIGRAWKTGSNWSKAKADQALAAADAQNHSSRDAKFWNEVINKIYPVVWNGPTFSLTMRSGGTVASAPSRRASRVVGKYKAIVAILFG